MHDSMIVTSCIILTLSSEIENSRKKIEENKNERENENK